MPLLRPVLLAGGAGTRLWPLSHNEAPKPFLDLLPDGAAFDHAVRLLADPERFGPPLVSIGAEHRERAAERLRLLRTEDTTILLEPSSRGTAAAYAAAASCLSRADPGALLLFLPTDHRIADAGLFGAAIAEAAKAAQRGSIVLLGAVPDRPATAYGYVQAGEPVPGGKSARRVRAFVEKPRRDAAEALIAGGDAFWNTGIVVAAADVLLAELARFEPELVANARAAVADAGREDNTLALEASAFGRCRAIAIDHALMERSDRIAIVPLLAGWDDLGSWTALAGASPQDGAGNSLLGDVTAEGVRNSYLRTSGPRIVAIGAKDLIVVATPEAVLVVAKDRDQEVSAVAGRPAGGEADR